MDAQGSSSTSGKTMWEGLSDAAGSSFSSAWLTGKTLERSLRTSQSWFTESVTKQRNEEDTEVQDNLERFDRLKKQMTQLSALSTKWAALQEELVTTEYNMALLLKEMGVHETACPNGGRTMGSCMTDAGVLLAKSVKNKQPVVAHSASFAANMDSFMQTALKDLTSSINRYDAARRNCRSADEVHSNSSSAKKDPEKQRILKAQLDEATNAYRYSSWQVNQKVILLSHHRSRDLCEGLNTLMEAQKGMHSACHASFSTWAPFKPDEGDALGVIEHCSVHPPPAPVVSPELLNYPRFISDREAARRASMQSPAPRMQSSAAAPPAAQPQHEGHVTPSKPHGASDDGFVEVHMYGGGRTPVSGHKEAPPGTVGEMSRGAGAVERDEMGLMEELGEQQRVIRALGETIGKAQREEEEGQGHEEKERREEEEGPGGDGEGPLKPTARLPAPPAEEE